MLITDTNSVLTTRTVTAVLPHLGPVAWSRQQLDQQAAEWGQEHAPMGHAWQIPFLMNSDRRTCAGCPNGVRWENCPYALWARIWDVQHRAQRLLDQDRQHVLEMHGASSVRASPSASRCGDVS